MSNVTALTCIASKVKKPCGSASGWSEAGRRRFAMPDDVGGVLMTVEEAAAYLRLAPWTIRHWVCQKKIPYVRLGRSVRFRRKDLERFVNQNLHGKTDERNGNGRPPEDRVAATAN
jgi:excisionase family DNA binding protein